MWKIKSIAALILTLGVSLPAHAGITGWSTANYLRRLSQVHNTEPMLISVWANTPNFTATNFAVSLGVSGTLFHKRSVTTLVTSGAVLAGITDGVGTNQGISTANPSLNTWFHMTGEFISSTSRAALLNGANRGTDTTSRAPNASDGAWVGVSPNPGSGNAWPATGGLAEVSIWSCTGASSGEMDTLSAALASGDNPINLEDAGQPCTLVAYWPLTSTADLTDASGNGHDLTMVGTLTNHASHPTIDAEGGGGGGGATHTVTTSAELTTAMAAAVAGDEIVLANGTYTGTYTTGNAGTSGNPITLRALNKHQAILDPGARACNTTVGLSIADSFWTVKDLHFRDHSRVIQVQSSVTNTNIEDNIFETWTAEGILLSTDSSGTTIDENVFGYGLGCGTATENDAVLVFNSSSNTITRNIIVGNGRNGYSAAGGGQGTGQVSGGGIHVTTFSGGSSNNNVIQGNMGYGSNYSSMRVTSGPDGVTATGNMVRDNIQFQNEAGQMSTDDCTDDANSFINNIVWGGYFNQWSTKGNETGTFGNHTISHNLFYMSDFTRQSSSPQTGTGCAGPIDYKINIDYQNNLHYADSARSGGHVLLWVDGDEAATFDAQSHNLFYAPGADTTWKINYTYQATDVHSTQPTFTSAATGDFSLATGSAGKSAASDGTDIGPAYNAYLRRVWMTNLFALPQAQNNSLQGSNSTSFAGLSTSHYYQVWFFVPTTGACAINPETFTIEASSTNLSRDMATLTSGGTWLQIGGASRWITLGHHLTDGTMNISWTNTNCVDKIHIRQMPTISEMVTWLAQTDSTPRRRLAPVMLSGVIGVVE
jgi:hypothetical protein